MVDMRAATILKPRELAVRRVPVPEPGPGQVLLRLEGTGVCASNLPLWQGAPWNAYPLAPGAGGHEGWGTIERVGPGVERALVGQRVAALSYCAYAECDLASAEHLVPLPPALAGRPFPGEALGCAFNILRRSQVEPGQSVAIVGVGFLGALLTRLATRAGARVIAISRRPHALETARALGASEVIALSDHGAVVAAVRELTGGALCDRSIEVTGKQGPLDLAAELTREHGRLVIAGYHQDGPRSVNMQLWNWRGLEVSNAHERDPRVSLRGMREAVTAVAEGWLDPSPLYTEFPLEQLDRAFEATAARPGRFMKALVRTGEGR